MSDNRTPIIVAIIGLIGTLSAAVIANLDKLLSVSQTPHKPEPTPSFTTPVAKQPVNPSPEVTRPDPTIAVRDHYEGIRGGSYYAAWERLPQKIRNNSKIHPNGYSSFEDWFARINPIKVTDLQITNWQDNDNVPVKVTYFSQSKSITSSLLYQLKWNSQRNYWEFVDMTPI